MAESVDAPDLKSVGHNARGSSSLPTRITHKYNGYTASVMNYRIDTEYAWYDTQEGSKVILVYMIQNVPFTFDELPEIARNLPEVVQTADAFFKSIDRMDENYNQWTDASKYADQYYGDTMRATTRFDNDWD